MRAEERIQHMNREFFDMQTYAIYSALNEIIGPKTLQVAQRSGEYLWADLKRRSGTNERDPMALVKFIGKWLQDMGYARIQIEQITENEFKYTLYDTASRRALRQIQKEKGKDAIMPHWSTHLMFAALKDMCNMKAELVHMDLAKEDTFSLGTVEKWKLTKID
jgi:hypothetical protein